MDESSDPARDDGRLKLLDRPHTRSRLRYFVENLGVRTGLFRRLLTRSV
jgi:hypothetical protein